jgi:cell division protein FtsW
MARTLKSDRMLFLLTLLLVGLSIVMVYSASAVTAMSRYGNPYFFLQRQLLWAVGGFVVMFLVMRIDYRVYRKPSIIWGLFGVTAALLVAVFFFPKVNGTHRWISFGFASLQPSEFAKLAVVLFASALLDRRMHLVNEFREVLVPIGAFTLVLVGLILAQPDYGTSAVIVAVVGAMVFMAGLHYRFLFVLAMAIAPIGIALIYAAPYRLKRLTSFLNPEADKLGHGYQAAQSLIAVGSGGVFGRGLMDGIQKLYYLPEAHTDFIYAVIGEEIGLVGTTLLLVCFACIAWRGFRVALFAPDRFGSLLAVGITLIVVLQALINMSVVTALLPTKGIPLPFVSNGGSSLLISMIGMGVLLNISQHVSAAAGAPAPRKAGWTLESQEA